MILVQCYFMRSLRYNKVELMNLGMHFTPLITTCSM